MLHHSKSIAGCKSYNKLVSRQRARIRQLSADKSSLAVACKSLQAKNDKNELESAEYKSKFKSLQREYESLCNTKSWLYTAPIRKLLDRAIKVPQQVRHWTESFCRFIASVGSLLGFPANDWVETANRFKGNIAVVLTMIENADKNGQPAMQLAEFLSANGYLVICAYWQEGSEGKAKLTSARHATIVTVHQDEFVARLSQLHPEKGSAPLCFIAAPCPSMVRQLPALRSAGFSIVIDLMQDWEASHVKGQSAWYEKEVEEQAVLSADKVVVSPPLEQKFSHLRADIVCINNDAAAAVGPQMMTEDRCTQLLRQTTGTLYMRNIYA
jgi:hypothetical protein